jgi:hypothetical protein
LSSYLKKKNTAKKVKDKLCGKLSLEMFRYPGSDFWVPKKDPGYEVDFWATW